MSNPKRKRIFVSSTINDLLSYRDAAQKVIAWTDCDAELVGPLTGLSESEVISECRKLVATCDLCVLIAGKRSGGRIDSHSFTSHEIAAADEASVPILVFMIDVLSSTQPQLLPEPGPDEAEWVARFRHRQNVQRPMDDVIHVADTDDGIDAFSR